MSSKKAPTVQQKPHTERTRKISQFSKETPNTGHQSKISQQHTSSQHTHNTHDSTDTSTDQKSRRISHHTREHGHHAGHHSRPRAGSKREADRHSDVTSYDVAPVQEMENTYKLEPDVVFRPGKVKDIIHDVLKENLKGQSYDRNIMASRCLVLSDIIKEKVCQLQLNRFKVVTMVLIGQNKDQALHVASRCLWNHNYDNFASYNYSSGNLCAIGIVYAVYQE